MGETKLNTYRPLFILNIESKWKVEEWQHFKVWNSLRRNIECLYMKDDILARSARLLISSCSEAAAPPSPPCPPCTRVSTACSPLHTTDTRFTGSDITSYIHQSQPQTWTCFTFRRRFWSRISINVHAYIHKHMHRYIHYTSNYVRTCVCVCVCVCVCYTQYTYTHACIHTYMYKHAHISCIHSLVRTNIM